MRQELKDLIEDLRLNHEHCPKEVILRAANELEKALRKTFVRLLQPNQRFTLLRTGVDYTFLRREIQTPSGIRYVVKNEATQKETTLHYSCHVQVKETP